MRSHADDRWFGYAVAASIVVHAVVLYGGLPVLRESLQEPVAPPPLVTRLVELPRPEEPAPAPPEPRKPEPRKSEPQREPSKPEAAKPLPTPSPIAEPVREPASPEEPPVAAQAPAPAPTQPPVDTRAAEAATAAQYRLQLIQYAQRNKPPYPAAARENNWTGDVVLEILIRADGRAELALRRGSGHAVLDKLALDTYQQALRAVPVPSALRGKQVKLDPLRVIYNLTEN